MYLQYNTAQDVLKRNYYMFWFDKLPHYRYQEIQLSDTNSLGGLIKAFYFLSEKILRNPGLKEISSNCQIVQSFYTYFN